MGVLLQLPHHLLHLHLLPIELHLMVPIVADYLPVVLTLPRVQLHQHSVGIKFHHNLIVLTAMLPILTSFYSILSAPCFVHSTFIILLALLSSITMNTLLFLKKY
jgi:hypothetical protein